MLISNAAIKNRTTVFVGIAFIIIAGVYSYIVLPRESAPDVKVPNILIMTTLEGVSPEDVESEVTNEIEKQLSGLKGLKEVTSTSAEGLSLINVEFLPDVNVDDALQRVKDKVDLAKRDIPEEAEEPVISEISIAEFPIIMLSLSGDISPVRLKNIAEDIQDAIEALPGVLEVNVLGAVEREIRVEMDPDKVAAYGLSAEEILSVIPSEHVNISAGSLETEGMKFNIRVPAEFDEPYEVDKILIASRDGKPIYLSDVAVVRDTLKDRSSFSRLNGKPSITISIKKRVGENIVYIAESVKRILDEAKKILPKGVTCQATFDQSNEINMMVKDLENNIFTGLILVVAVLVLFMGWRSSIIVALAIPLSMLMSFAILKALGITLNMVVLFSLILALGMLVDNAIVIVENIYRHVQMGKTRLKAAMEATAEVAWPVITSTLTTLAAFAPLLFWPGVVGDFMSYLPLTVMIVLSCSLFVAIVISPTICSIFSGGLKKEKHSGDHRFIAAYRRLLDLAIHHRFVTLSLSILLLVAISIVYVRLGRGVEFFPDIDPQRAVINIRAPQGTNIYETDRLARILEERVDKYKYGIENVVTTIGSSGGDSFGPTVGGPHEGNLTITFPDYEVREIPSAAIIEEMRESVKGIPGAEIKVEKQKEGPPTGAPITIRIIGEDFKELEKLGEQAKARIKNIAGLVNLRSDFEAAKPELKFIPDRTKAATLNVKTKLIGDFLRTAVFGSEVGKFREYDEDDDITVRLPLSQRENIDDLLRLRVPTLTGDSVPLSSLGEFVYAPGFGTIYHIDRDRVITLTADTEGRLTSDVLRDVQARLADFPLPQGCKIEYAGEKEEQDEASAFLAKAFVAAIFLIVIILVMQFNTLTIPLIIMTTVIMSMVGVFVGLLVVNLPFGIIMTGIGVISLAGVVVNNAIVLLDYTRKLQRDGMEMTAAAIEAGVTRLRPVMLTAVTTLLGLVPMALGISFDFHTMELATRSESSQWWQSMAVAVIFGLGFATLLTLVFVPCLYVSLYRLAAKMGLGGLRHFGDDVKPEPAGETETNQ